jgi:hypothetical protein
MSQRVTVAVCNPVGERLIVAAELTLTKQGQVLGGLYLSLLVNEGWRLCK